MRTLKYILLLFTIIANCGFDWSSAVWERFGRGIADPYIQRIFITEGSGSGKIYVATQNALYISSVADREFINKFHVGSSGRINDIYVAASDAMQIYLATSTGLYFSGDMGENWSKVFEASDDDSKNCLVVTGDSEAIYLGTQKGLFQKGFRQGTWERIDGDLKSESINFLGNSPSDLYIATNNKVYRFDKSTNEIKRIFTVFVSRETAGGDEYAEEDIRKIRSLQVMPSGACIYLAASNGIFRSQTHGETWERLNSQGLPLTDISSLLVLDRGSSSEVPECANLKRGTIAMLAGTDQGVYQYSNGKWRTIYKGLHTNKINYLSSRDQNFVYAGTQAGLFVMDLQGLTFSQARSSRNYKDIEKKFSGEPGIKKVHQWAIDYAEVNPQKIKEWRYLSRKKAWLPSVNIGFDGGRDSSRSDSVWGSYSSGGQSYVGPDDKTWGEDFGWDVSLSWDFGDLIWSTDQTTIDSRSKLMVELREDILSQITRLYYERRRVQIELLASPGLEPQSIVDKNMRIDELTALIDSYTGGRFSRYIEENYSAREPSKDQRRYSSLSKKRKSEGNLGEIETKVNSASENIF